MGNKTSSSSKMNWSSIVSDLKTGNIRLKILLPD